MATTIKMNSSHEIPKLAFGTWQVDPKDVGTALKGAIEAGYRHIDCAHIYGNEEAVGAALADIFKSGVVKREDLFITSKLWATQWGDVAAACAKTLSDLQLEYLDLYLIHTACCLPTSKPTVPYHKVWAQMEDLVRAGKSKSIGVSNWSCLQILDLLAYATIPCSANQIEIHPSFPCAKLAKFLQERGIVVEAYCPLGFGRHDSQQPAVIAAAEKHSVTPQQVLLRWSFQKGYVAITKSVNPERLRSNIAITNFELTAEEMAAIDAVPADPQGKICDHATEFGAPLYD
eukprot:NODE_2825_length_1112_cov_41.287865_g2589_i0.p1 GENE.NODE_2825_length_1112_cov_41.287865_g2589_i0~~NODE_2825_length_1112_cov_41.287865_g2589_i0.p1  ORF type:complete len:288 (+),score=61.95 NODE_2825_length_1112_cov_41.287865_g2589_i0:85-948(+)